jgi:hypothetical protein
VDIFFVIMKVAVELAVAVFFGVIFINQRNGGR